MADDMIAAETAVFDDAHCVLGEGPLWHPGRQQIFWFDITKMRLNTRTHADGRKVWQFDELISAAGWIDQDRLLIASEFSLSTFNLATGEAEFVHELEEDNPVTRSNDGRADPQGGFWIGTMGKQAEAGAGAIYRYYKGELRKLFAPIGIPNSISFPPGGGFACFGDSMQKKVWKVAVDEHGWPKGEPEVFIDMAARERVNDGAVFDAAGDFWCAEWGASRVSRYDGATRAPKGWLLFAARQASCPAFGGDKLDQMFVTSARQGLSDEIMQVERGNGQTFQVMLGVKGQAEHQVIL